MIEANAQLLARAQALFAAGRAAEAERLYRQLLQHTHVIDFEYDEWLKGIAECYRALGRAREAGYVYFYLHAFDRAAEMFPPAHRAGRRRARQGARGAPRSAASRRKRLYAEAARRLRRGRPPRARRHRLRAGAATRARSARAWERVLRDPRLRGRTYEEALVHFNVGLAATRDGDKEGGNRHLVQAQRLLEEVADEFETRGERERAFDCYASCSSSARTRRQLREPRRGLHQLHPRAQGGQPQVLRPAVLRGLPAHRARARGVPRRRDGVPRGGRLRAPRRPDLRPRLHEARRRDLVEGGREERARRRPGRDHRERLSGGHRRLQLGRRLLPRARVVQAAGQARRSARRSRSATPTWSRATRGLAGGDRRRAVPRLSAAAARLSRDLVPRPRSSGSSTAITARSAPPSSATCATPT